MGDEAGFGACIVRSCYASEGCNTLITTMDNDEHVRMNDEHVRNQDQVHAGSNPPINNSIHHVRMDDERVRNQNQVHAGSNQPINVRMDDEHDRNQDQVHAGSNQPISNCINHVQMDDEHVRNQNQGHAGSNQPISNCIHHVRMDDEHVRNQDQVHAGSNQLISNTIHQQNDSSFVQEADKSNWLDPTKNPLKLTLERTDSLLDWIQTTWMQTTSLERNESFVHNNMAGNGNGNGNDLVDKLKAVSIPFLFLRIGTWQKQSKHEGDLVAKCYFGRRKLVWEILEGTLKRKLQISWSDIIGLQIITGDNGCDIINLELNKPPSFAQEFDPKPRKHTVWEDSEDFTEGQATVYRRHHLQFPPGIIDKLYKKLFITDGRLFELSKTYFPTSNSPYFDIIRNNSINNGFPHQNSAVPLLQNVPFSSNGSFTPDLHQLPPTNNFSSNPIPHYFNHSSTTTGGPLCSFSRSNMVTSDFKEAGSEFTVKKDEVNIVEHHGIPQHSDNGNILVRNGLINIVEQNSSSDLPPLPVAISGVHTFQAKMEISGCYDTSQNFNRMSQYCLQGSIAAISSSSHDDERINQMNEIQASSIYDYDQATFSRGRTLVLPSSLDQQGRNTATDHEHIQASVEEYHQDHFFDQLHELWMPTEKYRS